MIKKDLAKKVTTGRDVKCLSDLISYPGKNIPGRGNSKSKDSQWASKFNKEARVTGAQWERQRTEDKVRKVAY